MTFAEIERRRRDVLKQTHPVPWAECGYTLTENAVADICALIKDLERERVLGAGR